MENPNSSPSLPSPFPCSDYNSDPDASDYGLCQSSESGTLFVSLVNIGCMVGALLGGSISDKLGRRSALAFAAVPFAAGYFWIGSIKSNVGFLIVARIVTGLAVGIVGSNVPVYISETVPSQLRGALGCVNQLAVTMGIFAVYLAGLVTEKKVTLTEGPNKGGEYNFADWPTISYTAGAAAAVYALICLFILPETPKWLVANGKTDEARAVLVKLRGKQYDIDKEIRDQTTLTSFSSEQNDELGMSSLLHPSLRRQIIVACTLMVAQQFSGINGVIFFSTQIFTGAGVNGAVGSGKFA